MTSPLLSKLKVDTKRRYKVGAKLGEGAFGSVYALDDQAGKGSKLSDDDGGDRIMSYDEIEWAVKVTPIPKPTRNRRSDAEQSARLLQNERNIYYRLAKLQGHMIPRIPDSTKWIPSGTDQEAGHIFLVMERLHETISDAVVKLPLQSHTVAMGPVACRLLSIVRAIHDEGLILTDVKPENFMTTISPSGVSIPLEQQIRCIDFGLACTYMGSKHLPDEGISAMRGTPLYASLWVHELHTPSRRDDVASLLLVIADLVIQVFVAKSGKKNEHDDWLCNSSYLPWANGKSEAEIAEMKKSQLADVTSDLFRRLPAKTAKIWYDCWTAVSEYKYKQEPEYDKLLKLLIQLDVEVPIPPVKKRRSSTRSKQSKRNRSATGTNDATGVIPMEVDATWEANVDGEENFDPSPNTGRPAIMAKRDTEVMKDRNYCAAILECISGPHKGERWIIQEGMEKYCIGTKPNRRSHASLLLSKVTDLDDQHAKLSLSLNKRLLRILVQDLNSKHGTWVADRPVKGSCEHPAYDGDIITLGTETKLRIIAASKPNGKGQLV